jgi:uncharacterized protein YjiS (DUF1127 family)
MTMQIVTGADEAPRVPGRLRALVAAARRRVAAARAEADRLATLRQLALMDEALLSDIGFSRNDIARMMRGAAPRM